MHAEPLTIKQANICECAEDLWLLRIHLEQLAHLRSMSARAYLNLDYKTHIKDLNTMSHSF